MCKLLFNSIIKKLIIAKNVILGDDFAIYLARKTFCHGPPPTLFQAIPDRQGQPAGEGAEERHGGPGVA